MGAFDIVVNRYSEKLEPSDKERLYRLAFTVQATAKATDSGVSVTAVDGTRIGDDFDSVADMIRVRSEPSNGTAQSDQLLWAECWPGAPCTGRELDDLPHTGSRCRDGRCRMPNGLGRWSVLAITHFLRALPEVGSVHSWQSTQLPT